MSKPFSRKVLFPIALLVIIGFCEFETFHFFKQISGTLSIMYDKGFFTALLLIPFIAFVIIPTIDVANKLANKKPIYLDIRNNRIKSIRLDSQHICSEIDGNFSHGAELVADADALSQAASKAIRNCVDKRTFNLAPFVVFTTQHHMSEVQLSAAISAIRDAGALDVKYLGPGCSIEVAVQFVQQHPTSLNLA